MNGRIPVYDRDVNISIVVQVSEGNASACRNQRSEYTSERTDFFEVPVSQTRKEVVGFGIGIISGIKKRPDAPDT